MVIRQDSERGMHLGLERSRVGWTWSAASGTDWTTGHANRRVENPGIQDETGHEDSAVEQAIPRHLQSTLSVALAMLSRVSVFYVAPTCIKDALDPYSSSFDSLPSTL